MRGTHGMEGWSIARNSLRIPGKHRHKKGETYVRALSGIRANSHCVRAVEGRTYNLT